MKALPQDKFSLVLSIIHAYSIDVCPLFYSNCPNGCFVVLFCRFHRDFGSSDGDGDRDGTPCNPFASKFLLGLSLRGTYSNNVYALLLQLLSRLFCCCVLQVLPGFCIEEAVMSTAMTLLVILSRYDHAWIIAHRGV